MIKEEKKYLKDATRKIRSLFPMDILKTLPRI